MVSARRSALVGTTTDAFMAKYTEHSTKVTEISDKLTVLLNEIKVLAALDVIKKEYNPAEDYTKLEGVKKTFRDKVGKKQKYAVKLETIGKELKKSITEFKAYIKEKKSGKGLWAIKSKKSLGAAEDTLEKAEDLHKLILAAVKKAQT
jgi:hypothetical protein